jgi:muconolactone delta-isomerase
MKIIALEVDVPGVNPEAITDELLKEEAARAWEMHQSGVVRELYFRADRHAAVLVLECADQDEARTILSSLPLARRGLIDFELIPLVAYPGFARLFE